MNWMANRPAPAAGSIVAVVMVAVVAVVAGAGAASAAAPVPFDLDGNGYAELTAGAPGEAIGDVEGAGGLNVLYRGPSGVSAAGDQFWSQDSPGVRGHAESSDGFGASQASGDFDGDGRADLAVGSRELRRGPGVTGGAVNVLYGSARGLAARDDQFFSQGTPGVPGVPTRLDGFGVTLAAGNFNGDGFGDLAVGAPNDYRSVEHPGPGYGRIGSVTVLLGSPRGLTTKGARLLTQDSPGVAGRAEADDRFGETLAAVDLTGDGRDELVIGVPQENYDVGVVQVLRGSASGVTATGDQLWSPASLGVAVRPGREYWFGRGLTTGDFDGDGAADLAIGAPGAGTVHVLPGTGTTVGVGAAGSRVWRPGTDGVAASTGSRGGGDPEGNGAFGGDLAAGDFDADGDDDLVVAAPSADIGTAIGAGGAHLLAASPAGLTATGVVLSQDTPGMPGRAETGDDYLAVSVLRSAAGPDDLVLGWPDESLGDRQEAGTVIVVPGGASGLQPALGRSWNQAGPGVRGTAEAGDVFGVLPR